MHIQTILIFTAKRKKMFFKKNKRLKIVDDDGMIALVNAKSYNENLAFREDWTWKQVNTFLLQTNKDFISVFETGMEEEWIVDYLIDEKSSQKYFRAFEHAIEVTDGCLFLASWSDITSSLQFKETYLPSQHNKDLKIELKNGFYHLKVKQLFDPEDYDYNPTNKVHFIIELSSQDSISNTPQKSIAWTHDFPNDDTLFLSSEKDTEMDDFLQQLFARDKNRENNPS